MLRIFDNVDSMDLLSKDFRQKSSSHRSVMPLNWSTVLGGEKLTSMRGGIISEEQRLCQERECRDC